MQYSLAFRQKHCMKVEKDTPYTSLLLAVVVCSADVGQRCTLHVHNSFGKDGYMLLIHTDDDDEMETPCTFIKQAGERVTPSTST